MARCVVSFLEMIFNLFRNFFGSASGQNLKTARDPKLLRQWLSICATLDGRGRTDDRRTLAASEREESPGIIIVCVQLPNGWPRRQTPVEILSQLYWVLPSEARRESQAIITKLDLVQITFYDTIIPIGYKIISFFYVRQKDDIIMTRRCRATSAAMKARLLACKSLPPPAPAPSL